jgi:hypothetical protein
MSVQSESGPLGEDAMPDGGPGDDPTPAKLSRKQEAALVALMAEPTHAAAAARAGVGEATLRRWLGQPGFQAAYRGVRRRVFDDAVARLHALAGSAVETLGEALQAASAAVQVRAAQLIVFNSFKAAELTDLLERVEQLERLMSHSEPENQP